GRRRVDRHRGVVRRGEERLAPQPERPLALPHVLAAEVVKLGARHGTLKFTFLNDLSEKGVGRQQDVVVEEDVVDTDAARLAEPRRVVGEKRIVDQVRDGLAAADRLRLDGVAAKVAALLLRRVPCPAALALLGGELLGRLRTRRRRALRRALRRRLRWLL